MPVRRRLRYEPIVSEVPWWLPNTDLCAADDGETWFKRDLRVEDDEGFHLERHLAFQVVGQFNRGCLLGLFAIRTKREMKNDGSIVVEPLGCAIPETVSIPREVSLTHESVTVSGGRRRQHGYGHVEKE